MAILSKIRDRSIALIAVIGLALFAFVLDPSQLSDFFSSSKINKVGEINGETISRQEFSESLDNYRARTRNRASEMQAAKFVWDNLVREKIYTQQLEKAGITFGEEDIWKKVISTPTIQNNPQFKTESGLFDENKFKQFLKETQDSEDQTMWRAWQNYMDQLGVEFKKDTYNNLVDSGLSSSLKEGEYKYLEDNTKFSGEITFVSYGSIPDSTVNVSKKEIAAYISDHESEFEIEESRSISYVKFEIEATKEDIDLIKKDLDSLIEDKKEFNSVSKREEEIKGFKSITDYLSFFSENSSDIAFEEKYRMISALPEDLREEIKKSKIGDVFGPYEEASYVKLLKVNDIIRRPDSVKSSHILIPFIGSQSPSGNQSIKTEEEAKKTADSIFKLVRRSKKKFTEIANEINQDGTRGKGGDIGWVSHSTATTPNFDADFSQYIFDNKKGDIDIVKSKFGFHIIRIDDQKNFQKAFKTVVFGRQIDPSEKTENIVFQEVEEFALELSKKQGNNYYNITREKKYSPRSAVGLKALDDRVPGLTQNVRQIITWAFQNEREINDFKRFDLDKLYVVAIVTDKVEEGLMSPSKALNRVRPILIKEKKAAILKNKMNGNSLEEIAKTNNKNVNKFNQVSLNSPSIPGIGFEPKVVGAFYKAPLNQIINFVEGNKGLFAFRLSKRELPEPLPNYESYRQRISQEQRNKTAKLFDALKEQSDIEDNRAVYYGIDN